MYSNLNVPTRKLNPNLGYAFPKLITRKWRRF
jgi:hypothetical protein